MEQQTENLEIASAWRLLEKLSHTTHSSSPAMWIASFKRRASSKTTSRNATAPSIFCNALKAARALSGPRTASRLSWTKAAACWSHRFPAARIAAALLVPTS